MILLKNYDIRVDNYIKYRTLKIYGIFRSYEI